MKSVFVLILVLVSAPDVWSQRNRERLTHEEQKLSNELKHDKTYVQVGCRGRQSSEAQSRDNDHKFRVLNALKTKNESSKLKMVCGTIEGDPIFSYLKVERGAAAIYVDTSEDDFGSKRVYSYRCGELEIGIYFNDRNAGRMVFRSIQPGEEKAGPIVLRCVAGTEEIIF